MKNKSMTAAKAVSYASSALRNKRTVTAKVFFVISLVFTAALLGMTLVLSLDLGLNPPSPDNDLASLAYAFALVFELL